jgi:hypothetical protein
LDVIGDDDRGHPAAGQRGLERPVEHVPHLCRVHDRLAEFRHVREQIVQGNFLLVVGSLGDALLLAHNRDHRLMGQLGVIQPVQQMDCAWTRGGHAAADLSGELGVGARIVGLLPGSDRYLVPRHINVTRASIAAADSNCRLAADSGGASSRNFADVDPFSTAVAATSWNASPKSVTRGGGSPAPAAR